MNLFTTPAIILLVCLNPLIKPYHSPERLNRNDETSPCNESILYKIGKIKEVGGARETNGNTEILVDVNKKKIDFTVGVDKSKKFTVLINKADCSLQNDFEKGEATYTGTMETKGKKEDVVFHVKVENKAIEISFYPAGSEPKAIMIVESWQPRS